MNAAHMIGKKKNRLRRLIRKLKECPSDSQKRDRKNVLENELDRYL